MGTKIFYVNKKNPTVRIIVKKLRQNKKILFAFLMATVSITCVLMSVENVIVLRKEQNESLTLHGSATDKVIQDSVFEFENIQCASVYRQSVVNFVMGEDLGEVTICGLEQEYLNSQYGDIIKANMEGEMPCIILDAKELNIIKNERNSFEDMKNIEEVVLRTALINGINVKICGLIPDKYGNKSEKQEEMSKIKEVEVEDKGQIGEGVFIYTNLQTFEQLMQNGETEEQSNGEIVKSELDLQVVIAVDREVRNKNIACDTEKNDVEIKQVGDAAEYIEIARNYANIDDVPSAYIDDSKEQSINYIIVTKNGRHIDKLIENMEGEGIVIDVSQDLREKIGEWEYKDLKSKGFGVVGFLMLICANLIFKIGFVECKDEFKRFVFDEGNIIVENDWYQLYILGRRRLMGCGVLAGMLVYCLVWVLV